mgnify:CR=1 FL=1
MYPNLRRADFGELIFAGFADENLDLALRRLASFLRRELLREFSHVVRTLREALAEMFKIGSNLNVELFVLRGGDVQEVDIGCKLVNDTAFM